MKKTIKHAVLRTLKTAGAFRWIGTSRWRTNKVLILCYHGIALDDEHAWRPDTYITAALLEERLEMLRTGGYTVLSLQDALDRLASGTVPPKSVVITFDDGLHNFYAKGLPILQKYGYPVTLYLTTYYCHHRLPVFPLICSYMLWKKRHESVAANPHVGLSRAPDLTSAAGRTLAWTDIYTYTEKNALTADQKHELARELAQHLHVDFDGIVAKQLFHLMTPEDVKEASKKGVDIQLHTHRHRSPLEQRLYQKEIIENRGKIEELTGQPARHFCYPSGVHKPQFLPWLSEQNVSSATTCDHGLADAKTNPLLLPRFLDSSNVLPIDFESWLLGVGAFLSRNPF